MSKPPWTDDLYDGATGIGPALRLAGGDDPPEWDGIGGVNFYHDKAYYTHEPNDRAEVDRHWYDLMVTAAEALRGSNPERADLLRRKAKLRYAVVRAVGWWWWMRH